MPRKTVTINQAGTHLSGWVGTASTAYRLDGKIVQQRGSRLEANATMSSKRGSTSAWLVFSGNDDHMVLDVRWRERGTRGTWEFFRTSLEPSWSERAVSNLPTPLREQALARIRQPLTISEQAFLSEKFCGMVRRGIRAIHTAPNRIRARSEAKRLFGSIHHDFTSSGSWTGGKRVLAQRYVAQVLESTVSTFDDNTLPDWDWLMRTLVTWGGDTSRRAQDALGINLGGVSGVGPTYVFEVQLVAIGGKVGVPGVKGGYFKVRLAFRQKRPVPRVGSVLDGWMIAAGIGFGAGVSTGFNTGWREVPTSIPYRPGDLNGPFDIFQGGASAGIGGLNPSASGMLITLHGTGRLPPLRVGLSSPELTGGAEVSVGLEGAWGRLGGGEPTNEPPRETRGEVTGRHRKQREVHFAFDDPSLTATGRQRLREFVARELRTLRDRETELTITGHASTKGPHRRNDPLSELRAENTAQAIRDLVGPALTPKMKVESFGQRVAEEFDPDETHNPYWQRVDIELNGIVVEQLRIAEE